MLSWTTASRSIREIDAELDQYEVDEQATSTAREQIRAHRRGWLTEAPEGVAHRYRRGELSVHNVVRRYGVVLDWGRSSFFEESTPTVPGDARTEVGGDWG